MRISDDRYHRDRLRLDIAVKFIEREARTHTIRQWTGLSDDRIRKLYRSYLFDGSGRGVRRHRGKSPHQSAHFMRTARMRQDASLLASVCALAGMLPRPGLTACLEVLNSRQPKVPWACMMRTAFCATL